MLIVKMINLILVENKTIIFFIGNHILNAHFNLINIFHVQHFFYIFISLFQIFYDFKEILEFFWKYINFFIFLYSLLNLKKFEIDF